MTSPPAVPTWTALADDAVADPWPVASLTPSARIRAIAAGLPGVAVVERVLDAPFDRVWEFIADLERSVPTFDRQVAGLRIVERDGTRLVARATSSWRLVRAPLRFDVDLEDGWCWMVARPQVYVVGMAAEPLAGDPGRTRYLHLEGVPRNGRVLGPLVRATTAIHRRHVASDVDGIERAVATRA